MVARDKGWIFSSCSNLKYFWGNWSHFSLPSYHRFSSLLLSTTLHNINNTLSEISLCRKLTKSTDMIHSLSIYWLCHGYLRPENIRHNFSQVVFKYIGNTGYSVTGKKCNFRHFISMQKTDGQSLCSSNTQGTPQSLLSIHFTLFSSHVLPPAIMYTHKDWGIVFLVAYTFEFIHRSLVWDSFHVKHKINCINLETILMLRSHLTLTTGISRNHFYRKQTHGVYCTAFQVVH